MTCLTLSLFTCVDMTRFKNYVFNKTFRNKERDHKGGDRDGPEKGGDGEKEQLTFLFQCNLNLETRV